MSEDLYTHKIVAPDPAAVIQAGGDDGCEHIGLRLDIALRSPVVVWPGIKTMDAPLAWAAVQQARYRGDPDPVARQHELGLAWLETDTQRCPMASPIDIVVHENADGTPSRFPTPFPYIKYQNSKTYSRAWGRGLLTKRPPTFDGQRGATVAGMFVVQTIHADALVAYVVADGGSGFARVMELLPYLTHIGKLHRIDFGAVAKICVSVDEQAKTQWLRRPLPVDAPDALLFNAVSKRAMAMGALESPYYDRARFAPVLQDLSPL